MRTRYNSQVQEIKTKAMIDCLQHNKLTVSPSFDFGFENIQVQKCRQME